MTTDLGGRVRAALDLRPEDAAAAIVAAVGRSLTDADPSARVEPTGYFNHSYLPDLVARWGKGAGTRARPYYLRMRLDVDGIKEDAERLSDDSPAIIGLLQEDGPPAGEVQQAISGKPTTMVTEVAAIERIASVQAEDPFARLVPAAVIRGGRGYIDDAGSERLLGAAEDGFDAAAALDAEATSSAVRTLGRYIVDDIAVDLERTLGVVWLGAGGDRDEFPAGVDLDSTPRPGTLRETLRILFARPPITTEGFWSRVASWITEDDLLSFGDLEPSPNLQHLMGAAGEHLKFVSVALTSPKGQPLPDAVWLVREEGLILTAGTWVLRFVTDGRKQGKAAEAAHGPRWTALKGRLGGMAVERVEFDSDAVSVSVDSKGDASERRQAVLQSIESMSEVGEVRAAVVVSPRSGYSVRCRFPAQVAIGEDSKPLPIAELGWVAVTVLNDIDRPAKARLLAGLGRDSD